MLVACQYAHQRACHSVWTASCSLTFSEWQFTSQHRRPRREGDKAASALQAQPGEGGKKAATKQQGANGSSKGSASAEHASWKQALRMLAGGSWQLKGGVESMLLPPACCRPLASRCNDPQSTPSSDPKHQGSPGCVLGVRLGVDCWFPVLRCGGWVHTRDGVSCRRCHHRSQQSCGCVVMAGGAGSMGHQLGERVGGGAGSSSQPGQWCGSAATVGGAGGSVHRLGERAGVLVGGDGGWSQEQHPA